MNKIIQTILLILILATVVDIHITNNAIYEYLYDSDIEIEEYK